MKYRIEMSGEDVLLILRWLETSGQTMLAVKVRDQYIAQRDQNLSRIEELAGEKRKPDAGFDDFFRGLRR